MKYMLRKDVLGSVPEVEITEQEYAALRDARSVLSAALAIEQKYELLISNYITFEQRLLNIAIRDMIRSQQRYAEFFEARSELTVCMVNLLTSARLYLDQLPQDISDCVATNSSVVVQIKVRSSKEYEEHFEYRFMEALRNHVQHRGFPIHLTRHHSRWTDDGPDKRMEFRIEIFAQQEFLAADAKFKKEVLAEVTSDVDLKATTRRYIESLSAIHQLARDLIDEVVSDARSTIETTRERYRHTGADDVIGLEALALEDNGTKASSIPLLLDWDDLRLDLQQRNARLVNLSKRYASGR